jgi:beta-lactamase class D
MHVLASYAAAALASVAIGQPLSARIEKEIPGAAEIFAQSGVTGTFVLLDPATDTLHVANAVRAKERFVPASTFKIPNTAIGLHVGAVKDIDEVLPYGGGPQFMKVWEQDMNLRDAIKHSNVPVYRELARRIGLERMRENVRAVGYGNMEIGEVVDRFWLDGPLAISAVEQVEFLERLVSGKLPINPEAVRAVQEITALEKTESYALHGKTGWYWPKEGQQIGWWVGWIERDGKHYPFALNIDLNKDEDAAKRIPIARECLKMLGKL